MTDTLDLLEAIGRDASLRHASTGELIEVLVHARASAALAAAVASGDSSRLSWEFAYIKAQGNLTPAHEEEPDEEPPLDLPEPDETVLPSKH